MTKTVASLSSLGSAAALLSLTACGGDVPPVLERATLEHALGTSSVQMHYEDGVLVGATSVNSRGDETEWTIEVDEFNRLRGLSGGRAEFNFTVDYEADGQVLYTNGVSSEIEVSLDGDRIVRWQGPPGTRQYSFSYGSDSATIAPTGATTSIIGDEGCGSTTIVYEWVSLEFRYECDEEQGTLQGSPAGRVDLRRDEAGRVVSVDVESPGSRWTFEWRDEDARSPPLVLSRLFPSGDHIDARGHFSFSPRWLDLPTAHFLPRE